jgi:hypothetical protein
MSHFAKVENGIVVDLIVAEQEHISTLNGTWIQTSYNTKGNRHLLGGTPLRGNYAGLGFTYDETHDVFYAPKPYPSWVLNNSTWTWEAPTTYPTDGRDYIWNEATTAWVVDTSKSQ